MTTTNRRYTVKVNDSDGRYTESGLSFLAAEKLVNDIATGYGKHLNAEHYCDWHNPGDWDTFRLDIESGISIVVTRNS